MESSRSGAGRTYTVSATRRIDAPPAKVFAVFADYREAHPRILPPSFFVGLDVEEGGYGAGTVLVVRTRFAGRTRSMRGIASEPEPGRLLVESYPDDGVVTSFRVDPEPGGEASAVTISTEFPRRPGFSGWLERHMVPRLVKRVYAEELDRTAEYVAGR